MRTLWIVAAGFLCLAPQGARAQNPEDQLTPIYQKASVAAFQTRLARATSEARIEQECGEGCVSPALRPSDALNEMIAGVAATFVAIEPGEFEMGSPTDEAGRDDNEILHAVKLTKGFEMQTTPVTQLQYFLITGRSPSAFKKESDCDKRNFSMEYGEGGLCINHPVEHVSWEDAQAFIARLNKIQKEYTYRLPTEAEWEYADRGYGCGLDTQFNFPYSFGFNASNELNDHAWYYLNSGGRTHAVATKRHNRCGLYDMNGNVWQWMNDWYGGYPTATAQDPTGPASGSYRVIRGGSWGTTDGGLRSAYRSFGVPGNNRYSDVGFRLVRSRRGRA